MDEQFQEVIADGVICRIIQEDENRLLVQPKVASGRGLNVQRWIPRPAQVSTAVKSPFPPLLSPEEIKRLAMILKQVLHEDDSPLTPAFGS